MADAMKFPKTMKEFIDGFSFKDRDEVYTNGSMLIPTFRVEQAIEHYGQEIRTKAIDEVFDFLKTQRDTKYMKVNFDDLEIRKYKEQMKAGAK